MPEEPTQPSAPAADTGHTETGHTETGYTEAGVPTLEGVRDKIEGRYGAALGSTELAGETPEARSAQERFEQRERDAAEKLEQIRASMREPRD